MNREIAVVLRRHPRRRKGLPQPQVPGCTSHRKRPARSRFPSPFSPGACAGAASSAGAVHGDAMTGSRARAANDGLSGRPGAARPPRQGRGRGSGVRACDSAAAGPEVLPPPSPPTRRKEEAEAGPGPYMPLLQTTKHK